MRIEKVLVTPQMAKQFLANQHNVRPQSKPFVVRYASDMASGNWTLTAHGLVFDRLGRMRDGQHRCQAVIKANRAVYFWLHLDCDEDEVASIDIGRTRALVHVMYPHANRAQRHGLQCAQFINKIETNKGGSLSPATAAAVMDKLGQDAIEAICSTAPARITAATRTAFVLAYPVNPEFIGEIWQHVVARDVALRGVPKEVLGTFEKLLAVTAAPIRDMANGSKSNTSAALFYRVCIGIHACLTGKSLQFIRLSMVGFEGLLKMRERKGLPTRFVAQRSFLEIISADREAAQ